MTPGELVTWLAIVIALHGAYMIGGFFVLKSLFDLIKQIKDEITK